MTLLLAAVGISPALAQYGPAACGPNGCPLDAQTFCESIDARELARSIVRVGVSEGAVNSLGSGTVVDVYDDGSGLVVTNNHVVAHAASATAGSITYRDGRTSGLSIVAADRVWDLAIVLVDVPSDVAAIELAAAPPEKGATLAIAGYGAPGAGLQFQVGRFARRASPGFGQPFEQLSIEPCQARQGDSGGPVFDGRGELVACLWGAADGRTVASPCTRIGALIAAVRARLGRRPRGRPRNPIANNPPVLPGPLEQLPPRPTSPQAADDSVADPVARSNMDEIRKGLEKLAQRPASDPELAANMKTHEGLLKKIVEANAGHGRILADVSDGVGKVAPALEKIAPALAKLGAPIAAANPATAWLAPLLYAAGGGAGFGGLALAFKAIQAIGGRLTARRAAKKAPHVAAASPIGAQAGASAAELKALILNAALELRGSQPAESVPSPAAAPKVQPAPAPNFVPTAVESESSAAMKGALEKLGSLGPQEAAFVRKLYSFRDVLINQAAANQ